ncbi:glycosyltransferase family 29 protein [Roseibium aestuarii]|uniref:Glycosyltransferase family 29 protein n=1 Tax=Roseibium aestuarii TaxID=2600299 RepID=A0ABW4JZD8_9HYPH|nr:glycosyltransferase family 29 protein [Roseibium aestuarii]
MPKVSLILPCYNVGEWLTQALDSALAQTLDDIEIIPVDDGSKDNTRQIIQDYADRYAHIRPIYKENGGYGTAVNAGLKVARGDYISILEPDDFIMEDYLWILYSEARLNGLSEVTMDFVTVGHTRRPQITNRTNLNENKKHLNVLFKSRPDYNFEKIKLHARQIRNSTPGTGYQLAHGKVEIIHVEFTESNLDVTISHSQKNPKNHFHQILSAFYASSYIYINEKNNINRDVFKKNYMSAMNDFFINHKSKAVHDTCKYFIDTITTNDASKSVVDGELYIISRAYLERLFDYSFQNELIEASTFIKGAEEALIKIRYRKKVTHSTRLERISNTVNSTSKANEESFADYVKDKSIAIVGNSPSEIGRNKGEIIDSHDIVFRFNNFKLDQSSINDYGTKTNCWVITPAIETIYRREFIPSFDYVISPRYSLKRPVDRCLVIYNLMLCGAKYFDYDCDRIRLMSNNISISTGLSFLIYTLGKTTQKNTVSIFGFSDQKSESQGRHYFDDDPVKDSSVDFHNWNSEREYIQKIQTERSQLGQRQ